MRILRYNRTIWVLFPHYVHHNSRHITILYIYYILSTKPSILLSALSSYEVGCSFDLWMGTLVGRRINRSARAVDHRIGGQASIEIACFVEERATECDGGLR